MKPTKCLKNKYKISSLPGLRKLTPKGTHWGKGEAAAHLHVSIQLEIIFTSRAAKAWSWNEPWRRFKGERDWEKKNWWWIGRAEAECGREVRDEGRLLDRVGLEEEKYRRLTTRRERRAGGETRARGEVGVTDLALVQDVHWHVLRRGGQMEFSSETPPEYPPLQAAGPTAHQRQKVSSWRLCCTITV